MPEYINVNTMTHSIFQYDFVYNFYAKKKKKKKKCELTLSFNTSNGKYKSTCHKVNQVEYFTSDIHHCVSFSCDYFLSLIQYYYC